MKTELLSRQVIGDLAACQDYFDDWRQVYNHHRPHEALAMAVPAERYQRSPRPWPEQLPPILYPPEDSVRKVQAKGEISFQGREFSVAQAFCGYPVALRPVADDAYDVYFCEHCIAHFNLNDGVRRG